MIDRITKYFCSLTKIIPLDEIDSKKLGDFSKREWEIINSDESFQLEQKKALYKFINGEKEVVYKIPEETVDKVLEYRKKMIDKHNKRAELIRKYLLIP